jgi:hypothetical protein
MFLTSLIGCSALHEVVAYLPSRVRYAANLRTCIAFQLYFLWRAGTLLYASLYPPEASNTAWIQTETMRNLDALAGYFVYDLCFLLQTTPFSGFVLHHLIGLGMIRYLHLAGPPPVHLLTAYNALCVVVEVVNPLLNLRHFVKGTRVEWIHRQAMFWMYTVFRVVLYPLLSFRLHQQLRSPPLFGLFLVVYAMSMVWYSRLLRMTWVK